MTVGLFPDEAVEELIAGMRTFRVRTDAALFVAEREDGSLAGYVEVGERPYADGCATAPVGYIEEWHTSRATGRTSAQVMKKSSGRCDSGNS
jgi:hypothetical protein